MASESQNVHFVRTQMLDEAPPPMRQSGLVKWIWENILESMTDFTSVPAAIGSILMIILTFGADKIVGIMTQIQILQQLP